MKAVATRVHIPTPLRQYADGKPSIEVNGKSVGDALGDLTRQYPDLRKHLYGDDGRLRAFVNVYVNDEDIRYLEKDNTPLSEGDNISIVPSIAGGAASTQQYPYVTLMNALHGPLELIDVKAIANSCPHKWYNQTLCQVNDSVVRIGVVEGEYHWHKHDAEDEFFYVVEGQFLIDIEGRTIELNAGQGTVIPKGVMHRPRAPQRTVILMVETKSIVPTGS
jgi:mannose-6-phosphate isomerase-like protein (cupin superfamily)/molybdopterin converting factor small subunit